MNIATNLNNSCLRASPAVNFILISPNRPHSSLQYPRFCAWTRPGFEMDSIMVCICWSMASGMGPRNNSKFDMTASKHFGVVCFVLTQAYYTFFCLSVCPTCIFVPTAVEPPTMQIWTRIFSPQRTTRLAGNPVCLFPRGGCECHDGRAAGI